MIILDATTKSLQLKLAGTVTANQLPFSASYVDVTNTATLPGEQDGVSNNSTAVNVVSATAASTQRLIKNIIIQNADTASATVTVIYNNNSTLRNIFIATLNSGDQLIYEDGQGWACLDKNGNTKTSSGSAVLSVSNSDGTLTVSPTSGNVVASLSQAGLQAYLPGGFVNKFRNGTMDIWQRGTGSSTVTTSGAYVADGWIVVPTGASCTAQQSTSNARTGAQSTYSLLMTGAASVTDILVKQRIESFIAQQLEGQTVTVQAQVFNNTGGSITPTLTVKHATAADNWASATTDVSAVNLQSCVSGSWTRVAYTFTASTSSGNGLEITFDFGNNFSTTGKSVQVTELDVRATPGVTTGTTSTPPAIELRPYPVELQICQRYLPSFPSVPGSGQIVGVGFSGSSTTAYIYVPFPVPARAIVSGIISSSASQFNLVGVNGPIAATAIAISYFGSNGANLQMTSSGLTLGTEFLETNSSSASVSFTGAEL
jgi:hypothetical protein